MSSSALTLRRHRPDIARPFVDPLRALAVERIAPDPGGYPERGVRSLLGRGSQEAARAARERVAGPRCCARVRRAPRRVSSERYAITLAVSEAVTNAVVHAYHRAQQPGVVVLQAQISDGMLQVRVGDEGSGMRPRLDSPGAGLGIGLIATLAERVEFAELGEGLEIIMTFAIAVRRASDIGARCSSERPDVLSA